MFVILYWSLILATGCYAGLAFWRFVITRAHSGGHYLAIAFAAMGVWTVALLLGSPLFLAASELLRDAGWLAYFYYSTRSKDGDLQVRHGLTLFCLMLAALAIVRAGVSCLMFLGISGEDSAHLLVLLSVAIRWLFAATSLFFLNYIYRATSASAGNGFRLIILTLGVMWAYNLNLFTLTLLGYPQASLLSDLRGAVALMLVPAFVVGARRKEYWRIALSRQATTQSLLFLAIGGYFVVIASATRAAIWAGESAGDVLQILLAVALTLAIIALAFMPRLRAHFKTFFIKHLFEYRYDYRSEWLRFSATIGDRSASLLSLEERAIRSLADITEAQGGVLLLVEPSNRLLLAGTWQLAVPGLAILPRAVDPQWLSGLAETARILKLDDIRKAGAPSPADGNVPDWLRDELDLWIAIPLLRSQRLIGIIALGRPLIERDLDWEDFDLLKVIAQQVAVHLSDAQSHAELEEARRFDEFNRRFAFIIHDLKNVVSQLALVSSNAEEHGANPKFQASMIKTLGSATTKMTTLLSRLSTDRAPSEPVFNVIDPGHIIQKLARETHTVSPISVLVECHCTIWADGERLMEALGHLLSNAIEASPVEASVQLAVALHSEMVAITIEDQGCGMSADFIRKELYKPFASTKASGFGIGAAEARAIVLAMGGELEVISIEGKGTKFSAIFPIHQTLEDSGA